MKYNGVNTKKKEMSELQSVVPQLRFFPPQLQMANAAQANG